VDKKVGDGYYVVETEGKDRWQICISRGLVVATADEDGLRFDDQINPATWEKYSEYWMCEITEKRG
jgi:hypothetical protein